MSGLSKAPTRACSDVPSSISTPWRDLIFKIPSLAHLTILDRNPSARHDVSPSPAAPIVAGENLPLPACHQAGPFIMQTQTHDHASNRTHNKPSFERFNGADKGRLRRKKLEGRFSGGEKRGGPSQTTSDTDAKVASFIASTCSQELGATPQIDRHAGDPTMGLTRALFTSLFVPGLELDGCLCCG